MTRLVACGLPLLFISLLLGACSAVPSPRPRLPAEPQNVLFVGNSLSFSNKGIDQHLDVMAAQTDSPYPIIADTYYKGGATLPSLWDSPSLKEQIKEGDYNYVILQSDIPEIESRDVNEFYDSVHKFNELIVDSGASTILFMPWGYPRRGWIDTQGIADTHSQIADETGTLVAPVGLAWLRALDEQPDIGLYDTDNEHPSVLGTYLAAMVIYATLFGESPVGHTYRLADAVPEPGPSALPIMKTQAELEREMLAMSEDDVAFLQRIAWETVQEYNVGH